MEQFIIEGGARLEGTITPAGNKNAALPALIATLLTDEDVVLRDLPDILDIRTIVEILSELQHKPVEEVEEAVAANVQRLLGRGWPVVGHGGDANGQQEEVEHELR